MNIAESRKTATANTLWKIAFYTETMRNGKTEEEGATLADAFKAKAQGRMEKASA